MAAKSPSVVALLMAILIGAACALVVADSLASATSNPQAEELQQLVGGLGCGPAVDLSRCAFSFDPRLCPDCPLNHGPVPGGVCFCAQHACSILYCRPLTPRADHREDGDGRAP